METKFDEEPTLDFDSREFASLAVLFPDELHYLRSIASVLELAADVPVITEGQQARELYLVKSGMLMVNKRHGDDIYEVGSITPGEIFGEASILYDAPAGAEVRTTEPTVLYTIPADAIRETIKTNERFERSLTQLAERRAAASALAVNPVFTTLPQAVREIILYNARFLSLNAGETLIREGDTDTRFMYIVLGGEAEASMQHPKDPNKRIVFARISSGDEVGEISVITGKAHVATVTALTPLRLMMISNESVEAWRKRYSDFGYALYACVQRKLQHSLEAIRNIVGEDMAKAMTTGTLPPLKSKHHPDDEEHTGD